MKTALSICFLTLLSFTTNAAFSQDSEIVIESDKVVSIQEIFKLLKEQTEHTFIYSSNLFDGIPKVKLKKGKTTVGKLLKNSISKFGYSIEYNKDGTIFINKNPKRTSVEVSQQLVSGEVTNELDEPLYGVNVIIKNTNRGTATDQNGNYKIEASEGAILVFTFLGYESKEVQVNNQITINISLKENLNPLNEVVLIGYGQTSRRNVTGSVSSLDPEVLESTAFPSIGGAIQGQLSGVNILTGNGSPGEPVQIIIRGENTLLGSSAPLIVLDDVSMPSEFDLSNLNPQNIQSIDVLKGASAAAIYGSRAASGVIIVETKRGEKNTPPQINYSFFYGVDQFTDDIRVLSTEDWKYMLFEGFRNAAIYEGRTSLDGWFRYEDFLTPGYFGENNTNWLKEMLQNSFNVNHDLSVRGGSNSTTYSASLGYSDDEGIMRGSSFKRYNANLGLNTQITDRLSFGLNVRGNVSNRDRATQDLAGATRARPDIRAYNDDGSLFLNTYLSSGRTLLIESPLAVLLDNQDLTSYQTVNASGNLKYELLDGLELSTLFSYYNSIYDRKQYAASTTRAGSGFGMVTSGSLDNSQRSTVRTEWTNSLNYRTGFDEHDFDFLLATAFLTDNQRFISIEMDDFPDDYVQTELWQGATFRGIDGYHNQSYMLSYISRLNYSFKDRYLLTASLRRDGSSKFSKDNAYGNFPAVAASWIASDESFLDSAGWLNFLKFRASLGKTGNEDIGYYRWRTLYEATNYNGAPAVIPDQAGNENLKWETTVQKDFGLDFGFFNSRIRGSLVYYNKDTEGLLYPFTMAPSTGFNDATVNFAQIENSGMEVELDLDIIKSQDFSWSLGFNFNNNKNVVKKLDKEYITSTSGTQTLSNSIIKEGQPLGLIYGYRTNGIYTSEEQIAADQALNSDESYQRYMLLGEVRFVDLNGDGFVDTSTASAIDNPDRTVIGNSLPEYSGGFSTNLRFKQWTIRAFGSYSQGNDKVWVNEIYNFGTGLYRPENVWAVALERWTPENPNSPYPSFRLGRTSISREFNDFSVYDASYIKIQSLNLEYKFSPRLLSSLPFIKNLSLSANVNNVHTFTNYPGPNPESYSPDDRIQGASLDFSEYPRNRTFIFGAKVTF